MLEKNSQRIRSVFIVNINKSCKSRGNKMVIDIFEYCKVGAGKGGTK